MWVDSRIKNSWISESCAIKMNELQTPISDLIEDIHTPRKCERIIPPIPVWAKITGESRSYWEDW